MKSKLGVFSNANALLVSFEFSHKELITANAIEQKAFKIMDEKDKNEVFALMNSSEASASKAVVGFPFLHEEENKKVEVIFLIPGADTQSIRYNAASIVSNLQTVEGQINRALSNMREVADGIEMLGFGEDDSRPPREEEEVREERQTRGER